MGWVEEDSYYCSICNKYLFSDMPDDDCIVGQCSCDCVFCLKCYADLNGYSSKHDIPDDERQGALKLCMCQQTHATSSTLGCPCCGDEKELQVKVKRLKHYRQRLTFKVTGSNSYRGVVKLDRLKVHPVPLRIYFTRFKGHMIGDIDHTDKICKDCYEKIGGES